MSENKPPLNPSSRNAMFHSSPIKTLPSTSPFINLEPSLTSSPLSPRKILKSLNHQIVAPSSSRALFSPKKTTKFNALPSKYLLLTRIDGKTSARSLNFKSPNTIADCSILITLNKFDWIQLDTIAAKINLDPQVKPTVIVGKNHGFLWIKQKTMLFSFGDNQYGQLGTSCQTLYSLKTLYPVSCPIIPIEICVLDTFTAIITQEGDIFVTGLFMVKLLYSNKRKLKDTGIELNPKKSGNQWLVTITYC